MKIKYLGPSSSVNIGGYPSQKKGEIVDYPDEFGIELVATNKKQKFVHMKGPEKNKPAAKGNK